MLGSSARYDRVAQVNVMSTLEKLKQDIRDNPTGTAFFAHLLIPHGPYVFNKSCRIPSDAQAWFGRFRRPTPTGLMADLERAERYRRYLSQLQCIYRKLDDLLNVLRQAGILEQAVIVLQGDHGSRISTLPTLRHQDHPQWTRMLRDHYSTLFAVRGNT